MFPDATVETFATDRLPLVDAPGESTCISIELVDEGNLAAWEAALPAAWRQWAQVNGFRAERHRVLLLPDTLGKVARAVFGLGRVKEGEPASPWWFAALPDRLPNGIYRLEGADTGRSAADPGSTTGSAVGIGMPFYRGGDCTEAFALGVALGRYRFDRYRQPGGVPREVRFVWPQAVDRARVRRLAAADALARDLVNTPAEDLDPAAFAGVAARVAGQFGARFQQWVGDELLAQKCHAIHAVGRAAAVAPRLVEMRWGSTGPRVVIVGKGVCFDTGGLDLKPSAGMALMKKDMGGAAMALALASLVMDAGLPVQLRVLLPVVENAVGSNAFRPGDVLRTRKGLTVEVTNTDAEGRLVLADALAMADEEQPDLLLDLATLTGAARVALGPEVPAVFANDRGLAAEAVAAGEAAHDPLWELPLWAGYEEDLGSRVADLVNSAAHGFAGAVIGALFLRRFVGEGTRWLHLDLYAWNPKERPGRPVGADAQGVRALFALLERRYAPRLAGTVGP